MVCPYCNMEMQKGYIPTRRDIGLLWYPEDVKRPIFVSSADKAEKSGGILFNQPEFGFGDCSVTAYICRSCRKCIISYEQTPKNP